MSRGFGFIVDTEIRDIQKIEIEIEYKFSFCCCFLLYVFAVVVCSFAGTDAVLAYGGVAWRTRVVCWSYGVAGLAWAEALEGLGRLRHKQTARVLSCFSVLGLSGLVDSGQGLLQIRARGYVTGLIIGLL